MTLVSRGLLVGSVDQAFDQSILKKASVTHILNVASELHFNNRVDMVYQKTGIDDDALDGNIQLILESSLDYIHSAITNNGVVLVHCLEGKSRSVCVALAYIVTVSTNKSWDTVNSGTKPANRYAIAARSF